MRLTVDGAIAAVRRYLDSESTYPFFVAVELKDDHLDGETVFHWRTFLRQKLRGAQSDYLRLVTDCSSNYTTYRRSIAFALLRCEYAAPDFRKLYEERKELLRQYPDYDLSEYLRESRARDTERIHYLTDNTKEGKYSGRCCPIGDADEPPDSATKESGFWVLANYDRFGGSKPAMVEVHGGASLEEALIPLIEIELANQKIECYIPGFEGRELAVIRKPFDGNPILPLYCSNAAARIRVRVKNREYAGTRDSQNGNLFRVSLDGHWATGIPIRLSRMTETTS